MSKRKWYEVHRHDGNIQYATKYDGLYYLGGSGFGIKNFDAKEVTLMDGEPPQKLVEGIVHLDDQNHYKGIVDKNNRWNGWHNPWILEEDIDRFIIESNAYTKECEVGDYFEMQNGVLRISDFETGEWHTQSPKRSMLDKKCYYLGGIGWCFEFKNKL